VGAESRRPVNQSSTASQASHLANADDHRVRRESESPNRATLQSVVALAQLSEGDLWRPGRACRPALIDTGQEELQHLEALSRCCRLTRKGFHSSDTCLKAKTAQGASQLLEPSRRMVKSA